MVNVFVRRSLYGAGAERVVVNSANALAEAGETVYIIVFENKIDFKPSGKVRIEELKPNKFIIRLERFLVKIVGLMGYILLSPYWTSKLKKKIKEIEIREKEVSCIQVHGSTTYAPLIMYRDDRKIVFCHSKKSALYQSSRYWYKRKLDMYWGKKSINSSQRVAAVSTGVLKDLITLGIDRDKLRLVYNFIDTEKIIEESRIEAETSNVKGNYIAYFGRLSKEKNIDFIIRGFLNSKLRDSKQLLIFGAGPMQNELANLIEECGASNIIKLMGFTANPYMNMKNASCVVLASSYEGFGMVLAESIAVGTPVISADCEYGPREIIENDYFLYKPSDLNGFINLLNKINSDYFMKEFRTLNVNKFTKSRYVNDIIEICDFKKKRRNIA